MNISTEPEHNSYLALLGAYERDNFGDILFLKVCMKLLEPWPVVPLSLVSRNMRTEGADTVISASAWFDCCQEVFLPKALIVAGGEVLNCPISAALSFDIDQTRKQSFSDTDKTYKKRVGDLLSWRAGDLAYVPDLNKLLDANKHPIDVALNSVGGSSLEPGTSSLIAALKKTIEQAKYTSVRDAVTHKLLNGNGSEQTSIDLNPDIVSALRVCCAHEVETAFILSSSLNPWLKEPYLLVQGSDNYIRKNGLQRVGEEIAATARALNLSVVLQPAGIATGHDSFEMLDQLGQCTQEYAGRDLRIHTQYDRNVWTQVGVIANAACFVGTSLHGRIVATAYARPRVALENEKVKIYASTWEDFDLQPFDVPIEKLQAAVKKAMSVAATRLIAHANNQADRALSGFAQLRHRLNLTEFSGNIEKINGQIQFFTELALLRESDMLRKAVLDLAYELSQEHATKQMVQSKLSRILEAPSWRLTKPVRAIDWLFSKAKKSTTNNGP